LKAHRCAILDVRTSAHHHMALLKPYGVSLFIVLQVFIRKQETVQTVKLTLYHRAKTLRALIYRRLIHRTEPNRPHISSDISISNSVETKRNKCALNYRRARPQSSIISSYRLRTFQTVPDPSNPSSAPTLHLCAAGGGVLRLLHPARKGFFQERCIFCDSPDSFRFLRGLEQFPFADPRFDCNFVRRIENGTY
jgi:hypothetical protein